MMNRKMHRSCMLHRFLLAYREQLPESGQGFEVARTDLARLHGSRRIVHPVQGFYKGFHALRYHKVRVRRVPFPKVRRTIFDLQGKGPDARIREGHYRREIVAFCRSRVQEHGEGAQHALQVRVGDVRARRGFSAPHVYAQLDELAEIVSSSELKSFACLAPSTEQGHPEGTFQVNISHPGRQPADLITGFPPLGDGLARRLRGRTFGKAARVPVVDRFHTGKQFLQFFGKIQPSLKAADQDVPIAVRQVVRQISENPVWAVSLRPTVAGVHLVEQGVQMDPHLFNVAHERLDLRIRSIGHFSLQYGTVRFEPGGAPGRIGVVPPFLHFQP